MHRLTTVELEKRYKINLKHFEIVWMIFKCSIDFIFYFFQSLLFVQIHRFLQLFWSGLWVYYRTSFIWLYIQVIHCKCCPNWCWFVTKVHKWRNLWSLHNARESFFFLISFSKWFSWSRREQKNPCPLYKCIIFTMQIEKPSVSFEFHPV